MIGYFNGLYVFLNLVILGYQETKVFTEILRFKSKTIFDFAVKSTIQRHADAELILKGNIDNMIYLKNKQSDPELAAIGVYISAH